MIDITKRRCSWCLKSDIYMHYHDTEWGKPVYDDKILFEFLILETFQAGLSWITILNKREHFRLAFDDFNVKKVALYTDEKIQELLLDSGIIRNRLKIKSATSNAKLFIDIQKEHGSFCNYIWKYVESKPIINSLASEKDLLATSAISDQLSKDLKKKGFKFVGSTVMYAFMQAVGMVNDHIDSCDFK